MAGHEQPVGGAGRRAADVEPEADDAVAERVLAAVFELEAQRAVLPLDQRRLDDRVQRDGAALEVDLKLPLGDDLAGGVVDLAGRRFSATRRCGASGRGISMTVGGSSGGWAAPARRGERRGVAARRVNSSCSSSSERKLR
jgi:hypothetical protein